MSQIGLRQATMPVAVESRRRPKDRKQHILRTASEMFRRHGYHDVGMSDIATRVGIVPSALYRHYRSKHDLLVAVLDDALTRYEVALDDAGGWAETNVRVAPVASELGSFELMWSRDGANLQFDAHDRLHQRIVRIVRDLTDSIAPVGVGAQDGHRYVPPQVVAWTVLAVMDWPAHRPLAVPVEERAMLLTAAADQVVVAGQTPLPAPVPGSHLPSTRDDLGSDAGHCRLVPSSRREALLEAAIGMFATRGYSNVSLDDIGDAVGIAGPSVYNHYSGKREILYCGITRAFEALWLSLGSVLRDTSDPAVALRDAVLAHARFVCRHWEVATVSLSHAGMLNADEYASVRRTFVDYVDEWRHLLQMCRPELRTDQAETIVDLALAVISGPSRIARLREPALPEYVRHLALAVLNTPVDALD